MIRENGIQKKKKKNWGGGGGGGVGGGGGGQNYNTILQVELTTISEFNLKVRRRCNKRKQYKLQLGFLPSTWLLSQSIGGWGGADQIYSSSSSS